MGGVIKPQMPHYVTLVNFGDFVRLASIGDKDSVRGLICSEFLLYTCRSHHFAHVTNPAYSTDKSLKENICLLVLGVISARAVNLKHIAVKRKACEKVA